MTEKNFGKQHAGNRTGSAGNNGPATNANTIPAGYVAAQVPHTLDNGIGGVINQFSGLGMQAANIHGMPTMPGMINPYVTLPDGQMVFAHGYPPNISSVQDAAFGGYAAQYLQQGTIQGAYVPYPVMPYTPRAAMLSGERSEPGVKDLPALQRRGGSYSPSDSAPPTPFFGNVATRDPGQRVAVFDRSSYNTPSPQQLAVAGQAKGVYSISIPIDRNLDEILQREPAVPKAVPAVFTPQENMKTLDQSLANPMPGNRNVYIRGLHPTTDDDLLYKFAERFGRVETSKAIIDTNTGACKGFGFAKFYDVRDSEMCIRGFFSLGYEVGFARESFNSRLKAEGDEESTNLYISNLPPSLTEAELCAIFHNFVILSSKILRDGLGNSRGVGFARFESRDVCDLVIKQYNGQAIGDEALKMQIRYADTPSQKELKRVTSERRQFRTNEYNVGAYGTAIVGMNPTTIYPQQGWKRENPTRNASVIYGRQTPSYGSAKGYKGSSGHGAPGHKTPPAADTPGKTASLEDGTGDEGHDTHVDSPLVARGSSLSSPVKQAKSA